MALNAFLGFANTKLIPLILAVVGFGLLIVVHELGHFLFAKAFGIHTPTFSIGFGPALFERKIGTTNFRIAKIPFGGYVEVAGLAEPGQGDQAHAYATGEDSFAHKPYWQKFLVLMGGIIFNLLFAYITFAVLFMVGDSSREPAISVVQIVKDSAADKFGLKAGDHLVAINQINALDESGKPKNLDHIQDLFLEEIKNNPNKEITIKVLRKADETDPQGTWAEQELHIILGEKKVEEATIGTLGAFFSAPIQKLPFFAAIKRSITHTNQWIYNIVHGLKSMFTQRSLKGAGGPVMIVAQTFKFAQSGLLPLLVFLAIMSINLAVFNLLPLGITDGGNLLFATIEAIIRRPTPEFIRIGVNLISIALFGLLFLYLTFQDVAQLFGGFFTAAFAKIMSLFS